MRLPGRARGEGGDSGPGAMWGVQPVTKGTKGEQNGRFAIAR
ncbi:UNVERIFIED_CONTAM: hypothetical protein NY100_22535 [Prevotella sp. 15_C9]